MNVNARRNVKKECGEWEVMEIEYVDDTISTTI